SEPRACACSTARPTSSRSPTPQPFPSYARKRKAELSTDVRIVEQPATSPATQLCLSRYYRELEERFDGGFDPGKSVLHSLDDFAPPRGCFVVLYLGGEPVGCGGFTPLGDDSAYLKRMWIGSGARGHGLGRRLLGELETR